MLLVGVKSGAFSQIFVLYFQPLPERKSCEAGELVGEWNTRTGEQMIELEIDTNACKGSSNEINYIEHVQAFISKFENVTACDLPSTTASSTKLNAT